MITAEHMAELTEQVLNRFAADLDTAGDAQFAHLSASVEALPDGDLGRRKRALVDAARTRRTAKQEVASRG